MTDSLEFAVEMHCAFNCDVESSCNCHAHTMYRVARVLLEQSRAEVDHLKAERDEWKRAENELSDAYLRVRRLVNAWDTKAGGVDRFEVTERRIAKLKAEAQGGIAPRVVYVGFNGQNQLVGVWARKSDCEKNTKYFAECQVAHPDRQAVRSSTHD
jgi:hypothetical protein